MHRSVRARIAGSLSAWTAGAPSSSSVAVTAPYALARGNASEARFCVRTVSDIAETLGQTPSFTGTRRRTSLLREVVIGSALVGFGVRQHARAGINFQACSFDHSDISPFRINDLRSGPDQGNAKPSFKSLFCDALDSAVYGRVDRGHPKLCQTF